MQILKGDKTIIELKNRLDHLENRKVKQNELIIKQEEDFIKLREKQRLISMDKL